MSDAQSIDFPTRTCENLILMVVGASADIVVGRSFRCVALPNHRFCPPSFYPQTPPGFGQTAAAFIALEAASKSGSGGAALPVEVTCAASRQMAQSYAYMFGVGGIVTGVLNKDVAENTGGFEAAAALIAAQCTAKGKALPVTMAEVCAAEVEAVGVAGARKVCVCRELLSCD